MTQVPFPHFAVAALFSHHLATGVFGLTPSARGGVSNGAQRAPSVPSRAVGNPILID